MIAPSAEASAAESGAERAELGLEGTWSDPFLSGGAPVPLIDPAAIEEEIRAKNLRLARESEISEDLRLYLEQLADNVAALTGGASTDIDPYLLLAAQAALIRALRLLDSDDPATARREMRTRLEQMRQVFRDIAEGGPLYEDKSAREIAQWLAAVLNAPQGSLAELLGVSTRTLQRWISESGSTGPDGEDARRIRVVARIVNHLRHALTGPGVLRWFQLAHPQLGGQRPLDVLVEPHAAALLTTLAASSRSHTAA